jgi:hypothetical protein
MDTINIAIVRQFIAAKIINFAFDAGEIKYRLDIIRFRLMKVRQ